jgi:hypothetical protein
MSAVFHPDWIEEKYNEGFRVLVRFLSSRVHPLLAIAAVVVGGVLLERFEGLWEMNFPARAHFEVVAATRFFISPLLIASVFFLWVPNQARAAAAWVTLAAMWIAWFLSSLAVPFLSTWGVLFFPIVTAVTALLFAWRGRPSYRPGLAALVLSLVFFAFLIQIAREAEANVSAYWVDRVWSMQPSYYYVMAMSFLLAEHGAKNFSALATNPSHLLFPLVWPLDTAPGPRDSGFAARYELWCEGALRAAKALLVTFLLIAGQVLLRPETGGTVARSLWFYLFLLGATVVLGNLGVGLAQMFGVPAPPGTWFIFLARSPLDFWKRDSTYAYKFAIRFIYFPAARVFKKAWPALIFAFAFFIFYRFTFKLLVVDNLNHWLAPSVIAGTGSVGWKALAIGGPWFLVA